MKDKIIKQLNIFKLTTILTTISLACLAQTATAGPGCDTGRDASAIDFIENLDDEEMTDSNADFILHVPVCATNLHETITTIRLACRADAKSDAYALTSHDITVPKNGENKNIIDDIYVVDMNVRDKFSVSEIDMISCQMILKTPTESVTTGGSTDLCEGPDKYRFACRDKSKPANAVVTKKIDNQAD